MANDGRTAAAFGLAAAALAGCGDGSLESRETAALRARVEAQAAEARDLRDQVRAMEARSRVLEERLASLDRAAPAAAAPAPAAPAPAPEPPPAEVAAAAETVAVALDTEPVKQKLREFLQAEEKAKEQRQAQAAREQMEATIRDRVTGTLTEQLGLDRKQQDAVVSIALDAMDRMGEVWRGLRDTRGDPAAISGAREKANQIRQESLDRVAQALTAEQYTKFLEIQPDGGGLFGGRGGFGPPGAPGGGRPGGTPR